MIFPGRHFWLDVQHSTSVPECPAYKPNPIPTLLLGLILSEHLAKNFYCSSQPIKKVCDGLDMVMLPVLQWLGDAFYMMLFAFRSAEL